MLFCRRPEKKCHIGLTLALCGLTAVGVAVVMNKGRCVIKDKMRAMCELFRGKSSCGCTE